jgi:excisionase family DNA binding protein
MENPEFLTPKQIYDRYQISRSYLYELFSQGVIPRIKMGRKTVVRREVMDQWIASLEEESLADAKAFRKRRSKASETMVKRKKRPPIGRFANTHPHSDDQ